MQPQRHGVLQVEPTDHCNLSCSMCAPHSARWDSVHGVPKGWLDPALWDRVARGLARDGYGFDHVIFQWLGEPTLHPDLPRLVGSAARHLGEAVGYLRIDTNGLLLDPVHIDRLIGALGRDGPTLLVVFSLDAATAGTYRRVKGGDHLDRVRRNVRRLLRARSEAGARINVQLQFVVQHENAHEVERFRDYWVDLLRCRGAPEWHDEILFKRLSVGGGAAGQARADALYERCTADIEQGPLGNAHIVTWNRRTWQEDDAHSDGRDACPALWLTPVIRQDGHLLMCCADLHGDIDLGSLSEHSFAELWEGEAATRRRLDHLEGRFEGVCRGCGGFNWYEMTPEMAARARTRATELGLG